MKLIDTIDKRLVTSDSDNPDLAEYPVGTEFEDKGEYYTISYRVAKDAFLKYETDSVISLANGDGLEYPIPGLDAFKKMHSNAISVPEAFHETVDYLKSPKGLFTLILCSNEEMLNLYNVEMDFDDKDSSTAYLFIDSMPVRMDSCLDGVKVEGKLYSTLGDFLNFIESL